MEVRTLSLHCFQTMYKMVRLEYIFERVKNMKIDSGTVNMNSGRFYTNSTEFTQDVTSTQVGTGTTNYTGTSFLMSYFEISGSRLSNASPQYDRFSKSSEGQQQDALPSDLYSNRFGSSANIMNVRNTIAKFHEQLIKRLEEFMEQIRNQLLGYGSSNGTYSGSVVDLTTTSQPGTLWTREISQSVTYSEAETTSFSTTGSVKTADGRSINFNISMEMSREFTETAKTYSSETQYILTDPLVVQLNNAPETISDQKWFFDIDGDGTKEEISQLAEGNGFLALDKNGNGIIDDGSELFGTKSGNGFRDLSAYDEDGNGWIDENDSVYTRLKIWTKDASGNDKLMDLKQADIGAIYLGAANTEFTHKTLDTNETQAVVRQTGFYLHESTGAAGTIQQIDFAAN